MSQTDFTQRRTFLQLSSALDQVALNSIPVVITYEITDDGFGIGHSNTVNPGEIVALKPGLYTFGLQGQVGKAQGGIKADHNMFTQVDRGGGFVDEPDSNIITTIKDSEISLVGILIENLDLKAQDRVRFMQRPDLLGVGLGLVSTPAIVGPPTIPLTPSVIMLVNFKGQG